MHECLLGNKADDADEADEADEAVHAFQERHNLVLSLARFEIRSLIVKKKCPCLLPCNHNDVIEQFHFTHITPLCLRLPVSMENVIINN